MPNNGMSKEAAADLIAWVKEKYDPLDELTAEQAGKLLQIPKKTIEYYARSGQIPKKQSGRHLRFSPLALAYWSIERHSTPYMKPGERNETTN